MEVAAAGDVEVLQEDDEAWLYGNSEGDETKDVPDVNNGTSDGLSADAVPFVPKLLPPGVDDGEANELVTVEDDIKKDDDDDDDSDDDDVQITIGDIKTGPLEQRNLFKGGTRYQAATVAVQKKPQDSTKGGVDVDAVGTIDGVPIYEYDLSNIQDKPWNKPGADITDYFNYGFNEHSWIPYCEKQKKLRAENNVPIHGMKPDYNPINKAVISSTNPNLLSVNVRRSRPHYNTGTSGISVIGGSSSNSRRPNQDFDSVNIPLGGEFDSAPPPPGVDPATVPAPDFSQPPPSAIPTGVTPVVPNPGFPPVGMPPSDRAFFPGPPPAMVPPPDRGPMPPGGFDFYNGPPPNFMPPPQFNGPPPRWSPPRDSPPRDWDYKDRSPGWSSGSDDERKYGGGRHDRDYGRDRDRERDRERDRYVNRRESRDGHESRERDNRVDRTDRSHDRERRHRDREHKRSRKHEDSDEERKRKHKKSKRSKREKEDSVGKDSKDTSVPPE